MRHVAKQVALLVALVLALGAADAGAQRAQNSKKTSRAVSPTEVLAWVGKEPITKSDLEARIAELSANPQYASQLRTAEAKKQLLDRMVEEKVWMQAAEKAGVPKRPELQRQLEQTRQQMILRTYIGELMQGAGSPSDSAITAYYEAHKTEPMFQLPPARKARHIQVATEKEARNALAQLRKGAEFEALAQKLSLDAGSKDSGGVVGRVERSGGFGPLGLQPALNESVFTAPLGRLVGPVKSTSAWHVVEVLDTIPAAPQPLETVRPRIVQLLSRQTQQDFYNAQLEQAKQGAEFRWNDAAVESLLHGRKTAVELFHEAQDLQLADERLAAYEKVVQEHPQSEQAPQAQFMIGFVYSEEKKDYDKAEAAFRKLLADYPKSELRNSAQWMLDHMRSDAQPDFELPGGVKRSPPAGGSEATSAPPGEKATPGNDRK